MWIVNTEPDDQKDCTIQEKKLLKGQSQRAKDSINDKENFAEDEIRWMRKGKLPLAASKGDIVIQIWAERDKKTEVIVPGHIIVKKLYRTFDGKRKFRAFIGLEVPKRVKPPRWNDFRRVTRRMGVKISKDSEITRPKQKQALLAMFRPTK
ncbi:MAG: hypothetical protein JRN52_12970 [Nitrososphaerota archaeon]|nr:hypothetical protein [Nitrososphaerota archaeon]